MIAIPDGVVRPADARSPRHYAAQLARQQWRTLALGAGFGVIWMCGLAAMPVVLGRTVDAGLMAHDHRRLLVGCLVYTGTGLLVAVSGMLRHRMSVYNWLQAALRTEQRVAHHVADHGPAVAAGTTTGEVVSVIGSDAPRIGDVFDVLGRTVGALAATALLIFLLLRMDVLIGLWVVLGLPVLLLTLAGLVRPLTGAQRRHRQVEGELTALGADTVAGLRVLRGIGGEAQFADRYRSRSQQVRTAGVRVAGVQSLLDAAHVLLPGVFVVTLTWLAADAAIAGRLTPGQVVTVFGYAGFLQLVLQTLTEALAKAVRGRIAIQRVLAVLARREPVQAVSAPAPPPFVPLHDPTSGLTVTPRRFTGVVADDPDDVVALADRLVRLDRLDRAAGTEAPRLGGTPLDRLARDDVRARILLSEAEPHLFGGTVRTALDPEAGRSDAALLAALEVADARDVLALSDQGLDAPVEERGRGYSGGQRQRLALARAVLRDPEILVLVEPTSAVDAHTEDRIAARLIDNRRGRTTLVGTSSPLVLSRCDRVVMMLAGRQAAAGTHELLASDPRYRALVVRDENEGGERR